MTGIAAGHDKALDGIAAGLREVAAAVRESAGREVVTEFTPDVRPFEESAAMARMARAEQERDAFQHDLTNLREGLMDRAGGYIPSDADLLAYVDGVLRERDEARAEVERLRTEVEALREIAPTLRKIWGAEPSAEVRQTLDAVDVLTEQAQDARSGLRTGPEDVVEGAGGSKGLGGRLRALIPDTYADDGYFGVTAVEVRQLADEADRLQRERDAADAAVERVEDLAESEASHGDAITRCNLVAQRIRDAIDGPKNETKEGA